MKKFLKATLATLMVCALAACGSGKKDNKDSTGAIQPNTSVGGNVSTGGDQTITIAFDFSGTEESTVQYSSYNVFDGISVLTSTGIELKTRTTATSPDCGLEGKLLNTSEVRTCTINYVIDYSISGQKIHEEATRTVEVVAPTIQEGNLVSNPIFELGTQDWELATHEGGTGEFSVVKDTEINQNVAKVVMTGLNWTNDSSPRLNSATYATNGEGEDKRFTMTGGQNYKVSFRAKALTTKYVNVSIGQLMPATPWYEGFTSSEQTYTAAVGTEWQKFEYTFTATHATLEGCSILFSMGKVAPTADVITTLWFADVYVGVYSGAVVDEAAPTINGANDVTLAASSNPYDVLYGINVTDNVDTDIVAEAFLNGNKITSLDISKAGTYTITYKAKDAAGNEAEATRIITVVATGTNLLAGVDAARLQNDSWCESWLTQAFTAESDGSIKVHTVGIGEQSYVNQINLNNLPIVGGNSYTLTFKVKSTVAFNASFIQNQNPYTSYASASIAGTGDWETITMVISAPEVDPVNKLTMELGLVASDITFWVKDFSLVQN